MSGIQHALKLLSVKQEETELNELKKQKAAEPRVIISTEFNIANPEELAMYAREQIYDNLSYFTTAMSTTDTIEGLINNVYFTEEELIKRLAVSLDDRIPKFSCNYGRPSILPHEPPRKTTKRPKKPRKKQGDGKDFNSQITFHVRARSGIIYKFKVFRTGKIQLPGIRHDLAGEAVVACGEIVRVLNFHLHAEAPVSCLVYMRPVMKNYKFVIKLANGRMINLARLRELLIASREASQCPIYLIKHARQDTRLSIKFSTPTEINAVKKTRVNIFMSGKINILGALDVQDTKKICIFLHRVIERHFTEIVERGGIKLALAQNIAHSDEEDAAILARSDPRVHLARALNDFLAGENIEDDTQEN